MSVTLPVLDVVCLCAAWCRTCDEYQAVLTALQAAAPEHRYRWIDIEDEADRLGEIDVETFPTLMLAHHGQLLFAGPVLPRLGDAQRLLASQVERVQNLPEGPWTVSGAGLDATQLNAFTALAQTLN